MWLIFSLLAAGSESLKDIFSKFSSTKTDVYTASFSLHFFSILLILPFLFWDGIPQLKTSFWLGSIAFLIITPLWTILYMKALRVSEISKVMSLMAFNPLFTGLLAFAFSEIKPTRLGWAGIILVCVGVYVANSSLRVLHKDIFFPIKNIFSDPGALAMLGVAFLWSLGAHFSKMRVEGSSAVFSTFTGGVIGVVTTYLVAILKKQRIQFSTLLQKNGIFSRWEWPISCRVFFPAWRWYQEQQRMYSL